jgi:hypothetical protein
MNTLTAINPSAESLSHKHTFLGVFPSAIVPIKGFGKCPLLMLSVALAIIIPNAAIAAQSAQMQLGMLPGANANVSDLDFRYRFSGDPSLKPLRVYNNSITTTIEFAKTSDGEPPTLQIEGVQKYLNSTVKLFKDPDRLIVDGLFDSAELVYSGTRKGSVTIERLVKTGTGSKGLILQPIKPEVVQAQPKEAPPPVVAAPVKPVLGGAVVVQSVPTPPTVQAEGFAKPVASASPAAPAPVVAAPIAVAPPKPVPPPIPTWTVSPQDKTIREALKNWTVRAGWTFEPEYWTLPMDIPVTATATFSGDFKSAVRQLIAATELSDTPSQPCFYLNRVVRVVPINQVCDQMSAR